MEMAWNPFLRDFDAEIEAEAAQLKQHDQAPSESEITARIQAAADEAREAGYREGRAEALSEAEATLAAARVAALEGLKPRLAALGEDLVAHQRALEADMVSFLLTIFEKALPHVIEAHGPTMLEAELRRIARRAQGSRGIEVRVSPSNLDHVRITLKDLLPEEAGRSLRVTVEHGLGDSEIRAEWQGGRSDMSHERLCRSIIDKLKSTSSRTADQKENFL